MQSRHKPCSIYEGSACLKNSDNIYEGVRKLCQRKYGKQTPISGYMWTNSDELFMWRTKNVLGDHKIIIIIGETECACDRPRSGWLSFLFEAELHSIGRWKSSRFATNAFTRRRSLTHCVLRNGKKNACTWSIFFLGHFDRYENVFY